MSYCQNYILVAALGLSIYGVREVSRLKGDDEKRTQLIFELVILHLSFTTLALILYFLSIPYILTGVDTQKLALAGGILIFSSVFSIEWLFAGMGDFKFIAVRSIGVRIAFFSSMLLLVRSPKDYDIYLFLLITQVVVSGVLNTYYGRRYIRGRFVISIRGIKSHISPLLILGAYSVLTSIYAVLPNSFLGVMSSSEAVGYFSSSDKLVRVFISIFSALSIVMVQRLNSVWHVSSKSEGYGLLVCQSLEIVVGVAIPISAFVFLFSDSIVLVAAGHDFEPAISCLRIMAPIIVCVAIAQISCIQILSVHKHDKTLVGLAFVGMVISVAINMLYIPSYSFKAAAYAQLFSESIVSLISVFYAIKVYPLKIKRSRVLAAVFISLGFYFVHHFVSSLLSNEILVLIFGASMCSILFLFSHLFLLRDSLLRALVRPYFVAWNMGKLRAFIRYR